MIDENSQNDTGGQGGIDSETEQRNRENETGQQGLGGQQGQSGEWQAGQSQGGQSQGGQADYGQAGQQAGQSGGFGQQQGQSETMTDDQSQGGQSASGQAQPGQPQAGQLGGEGGTGFVGSGDDQSSDYLTEGDNEDFQPEGQGASDTNGGTEDITTGQSQSDDASFDDGSDTSR